MEWVKLLSEKKFGNVRSEVDEGTEGRSKFQRDCDRIIFSTAFRRLQHKTQVIPLPYSDHVHNRLTHSLETCSIGRSLGMLVGTQIVKNITELNRQGIEADDFAHILAAACLAHDIGNPPLGHSGESAISEFFKDNEGKFLGKLSPEQKTDFTNFEGNALGFRMLVHSFPYESDFRGGMGLTYATLAAYTKYPKEFYPIKGNNCYASEKKHGFFQAEKEIFQEIAENVGLIPKHNNGYLCWHRHPLAFLSESADDICNLIIDLEDGYRERLVGFTQIEELLKEIIGSALIKDDYTKIHDDRRKIKFLRARALNQLIIQLANLFIEKEKELLEGQFDYNLVDYIHSKEVLDAIGDLERRVIYRTRQVLEVEAAGFEILPGILDAFLSAIILNRDSEKSNKIKALIPRQYFDKGDKLFENDYVNLLNVVHFVANMTDNFAVDTYRLLKGTTLPSY